MSRRKKGNPVHGWVVLDKPLGMTSTQAVGAVRRLFEAQKAGHAGTLDPLATGILPIALGEATKTVPFAVDGEKAYRFTVRFGIETDTDDAEGQIVRTSEKLPTAEEIDNVLADFTGEISQVPPTFSAIKVEGNRAYDLARSGESVVLEPRWIVVEDLRLIEMTEGAAVLEAECGKGTYVRALARDMGRALGSAAHVIGLRRTRVGAFDEAVSVKLDTLRAAAEAGGIAAHLRPVEAALDDIPGLSVGAGDAVNLARGQAVLVRGRDAPVLNGAAYAHFKGRILALGELEKGAFRPTRVFNFG
jgi:tRNA pseudouridine55 synthase